MYGECLPVAFLFQSTLPVRGATDTLGFTYNLEEISIHAPRAGSDEEIRDDFNDAHISIHAPRAGSDHDVIMYLVKR